MKRTTEELRTAIRAAASAAFSAVRAAHPSDTFYYFALVTTEDGLRPGPSASSLEGLAHALEKYERAGRPVEPADLRWSEADSPYNLYGDEHFSEVERLFLEGGDHRDLPVAEYHAELAKRFGAMEGALLDLDRAGFFGKGAERQAVAVNLVAPGDWSEKETLAQAARLNPPESLRQLREDLADPA